MGPVRPEGDAAPAKAWALDSPTPAAVPNDVGEEARAVGAAGAAHQRFQAKRPDPEAPAHAAGFCRRHEKRVWEHRPYWG